MCWPRWAGQQKLKYRCTQLESDLSCFWTSTCSPLRTMAQSSTPAAATMLDEPLNLTLSAGFRLKRSMPPANDIMILEAEPAGYVDQLPRPRQDPDRYSNVGHWDKSRPSRAGEA